MAYTEKWGLLLICIPYKGQCNVGDQLLVPAAFLPGEETPISIE
jgi:hypothetical protein